MPTFWQRLQSIFYPICIRKGSSAINPRLELFYYHGRYMLGAEDAMYSDGAYYRPLVAAFTSPVLKAKLAEVRQVLVLGTGLASAVHVLHRYGWHPQITLVELDRLVLDWALEFLPSGNATDITPICADAADFITADKGIYDLIVVDVFCGREVPDFVTQTRFLHHCANRLRVRGNLVLNYMVNHPLDSGKAKAALDRVFKEITEIPFGINKVYIASGTSTVCL